MKNITRVLAIGAHPDDIELGCGGSLAKLTEKGVEVHALILYLVLGLIVSEYSEEEWLALQPNSPIWPNS